MPKLKKVKSQPRLYTVEETIAEHHDKLPLLPFDNKLQVWKAIRNLELRAINIGTKARPRYRIPDDAIRDWWQGIGYKISPNGS